MRIIFVTAFIVAAWAFGAVASEARYEASVTSGWTDNATDTPAGGADLFVEQGHAVAVGLDLGWAVLRGTISAETRHHQSFGEADDWVARGGGSIEVPLPGMVLRGSAALTRESDGKFLLIGDLLVPLRSERTQGEVGFELVAEEAGIRRSTAGVSLRGVMNDPTSFPTLPVAAERLSPDVGMLTFSGRHEVVIGADTVLNGAAQYRNVRVPADDSLAFGRTAFSALGLRLGLEARPVPDLTLKADAGAESYFDPGGLAVGWLPVGRIEAETRIGDVQIGGAAGIDLELFDPVDGAASRKIVAAMRLAHPGPSESTLLVSLDASHEQGLIGTEAVKRKLEFGAALEGRLTEMFGYRLGFAQGLAGDSSGAYATRTLRLTLSGSS
ncbi:hypothetical protein SAMN02983003_1372 [Devosia enhydra]|uniref:Uncharacterized protein n=1 Tax=Devosia enhydra TaxID=665118 RepID=A0A1K2HVW8_9HYPH|nr:hypothetical protein [Devosia enhydra]SFZ82953.1 hypothetical protein SAMN02983003_1372 [Devosia enhydra]